MSVSSMNCVAVSKEQVPTSAIIIDSCACSFIPLLWHWNNILEGGL